jgi:hypothetical protein
MKRRVSPIITRLGMSFPQSSPSFPRGFVAWIKNICHSRFRGNDRLFIQQRPTTYSLLPALRVQP